MTRPDPVGFIPGPEGEGVRTRRHGRNRPVKWSLMRVRLALLALAAVVLLGAPAGVIADEARPTATVLVIQLSSSGYVPMDRLTARIMSSLAEHCDQRVDVQTEFLDVMMSRGEDYNRAVQEYIRRKYAGARIVAPAEVARRGAVDEVVSPGDVVAIGETPLTVLDVGGHTLGHIAYYSAADAMAFVGDALFPMGCGRLFEGDAAQMWASLQRLAALPGDTTVYCAHEYAAANARFALSVDEDPGVAERAARVFAMRARGEATVPTTVAIERATNPFLRAPVLRPALSSADAFGEIRRLKDGFAG